MSRREQKKYFEVLKRYEKNFDSSEAYEYKMFAKRHKDDEDLDKISLSKLNALYEKYHINRPKKNYDHFFKKSENAESES